MEQHQYAILAPMQEDGCTREEFIYDDFFTGERREICRRKNNTLMNGEH
jgi:hypothetical protein